MKRIFILLVLLTVRQILADTPWRFQGTAVDGFDRPVEGVLIHVYNGHMGLDKFEIDSESVTTSRFDGTFAGLACGEHANTYRRIEKAPYAPKEECGNWSTNGVVRLLLKRSFTSDEAMRLASAQGSALCSNIMSILSHDWSFEDPLCLFPVGNRVRPAVLKALQHPSEHIRSGAQRLLRQHIGHPEDMDYTAESGTKRPTQTFTLADMDQVIKKAVAYVTEKNRYERPTAPKCLMNRDGCEALVFFDASDATVNGHQASFYLHLSKGLTGWTFDYWGLSVME